MLPSSRPVQGLLLPKQGFTSHVASHSWPSGQTSVMDPNAMPLKTTVSTNSLHTLAKAIPADVQVCRVCPIAALMRCSFQMSLVDCKAPCNCFSKAAMLRART
jgi:hypothetical protein